MLLFYRFNIVWFYSDLKSFIIVGLLFPHNNKLIFIEIYYFHIHFLKLKFLKPNSFDNIINWKN